MTLNPAAIADTVAQLEEPPPPPTGHLTPVPDAAPIRFPRSFQIDMAPGSDPADFAAFSADRAYRFALGRRVPPQGKTVAGRRLLVVTLAPTAAGAVQNDPMVWRCLALGARELCDTMQIISLFGLIPIGPDSLKVHGDPIGSKPNSRAWDAALVGAGDDTVIVAGWGSKLPPHRTRYIDARRDLLISHGAKCLGVTGNGQPRNPLNVEGDTPLVDLTERG